LFVTAEHILYIMIECLHNCVFETLWTMCLCSRHFWLHQRIGREACSIQVLH